MKRHRTIGTPTAGAIEDAWQRKATEAAIAAVRDVTKPGGAIPPGVPVGWLSDNELGWIVAAVLFAWISTRVEQAVAEEIDTELAVRMTGLDPDPWDAGAAASVLPELAETSKVDWNLPMAQWPRKTMLEFLLTATRLIRKAEIARDLSGRGVTRQSGAISREANAAAGGPLMTPNEFNDPIDL